MTYDVLKYAIRTFVLRRTYVRTYVRRTYVRTYVRRTNYEDLRMYDDVRRRTYEGMYVRRRQRTTYDIRCRRTTYVRHSSMYDVVRTYDVSERATTCERTTMYDVPRTYDDHYYYDVRTKVRTFEPNVRTYVSSYVCTFVRRRTFVRYTCDEDVRRRRTTYVHTYDGRRTYIRTTDDVRTYVRRYVRTMYVRTYERTTYDVRTTYDDLCTTT